MRRPRLPPLVVDTGLALLLAVPTIGGLVADEAHVQRPWWFVAPVAALTTLPLAFRRTRPLAVFAITLGALVVLLVADVDTFSPGVAVASYTLAAYCARPTALKAGVVGLLALVPASSYASGPDAVFGFLGPVVFTGAAWVLGDNIRTRRAYLRGSAGGSPRPRRTSAPTRSPSRVADGCRGDALDLAEGRLDTPEAARSERRLAFPTPPRASAPQS
jgi:hypothetical protein